MIQMVYLNSLSISLTHGAEITTISGGCNHPAPTPWECAVVEKAWRSSMDKFKATHALLLMSDKKLMTAFVFDGRDPVRDLVQYFCVIRVKVKC